MCVRVALLALASTMVGCNTGAPTESEPPPKPAAEIVAPKDGAKVEQVEDLEGQVRDPGSWPVVLVRPLHVADAPWYVQPEVATVKDKAFTTRIFLGDAETPVLTKFEVAVLVMKDKAAAEKYKKGQTLAELPAGVPRSKSITVQRAAAAPPELVRTISFAGRDWEVKVAARFDPGPNAWGDSPENVHVDDQGHLHLAVTQVNDKWHCAEVVGPSLGYGEYTWVVAGDVATLDPQVVVGLFVYRDQNHEIDIELSRWGEAGKPNAQFVIQPPTKASMHRFDTGSARILSCSFSWSEDLVWCRCWTGVDKTRPPLAEWKYTGSRLPRAGGERVRMNLWLFGGKSPMATAKQEVVLRSFLFKPTGAPPQN